MKFKKIVSLSASLVMCASMITGCSSKSENEGTNKTSDISVGIVLGEGSINDESFNQATWEGLKQAEEEFGISFSDDELNGFKTVKDVCKVLDEKQK